jgi:hypothetical protein
MAYIKKLKENELIGGTDNTDVYPVTTSQAIFRQNPDGHAPEGVRPRLEDTLQYHEKDAQELHRKTEKLKLTITNSKGGSTIEIADNNQSSDFIITLTGKAYLETFGDEPDEVVKLNDESTITLKQITKEFSVTYGTTALSIASQTASGNSWVGTCDLSQGTANKTIGTYTSKFTVSYLGVEKSITSPTYIGLRAYAGFTEEESATVDTDLNTWSSFSPYISRMDRNVVVHDGSSSSVRMVFPAVSGDVGGDNPTTRYIHFLIPAPLKVSRITQPDGLGQELAFTNPNITVIRIIDGQDYTYNVYRTTLPQGSWRQLRLDVTISK